MLGFGVAEVLIGLLALFMFIGMQCLSKIGKNFDNEKSDFKKSIIGDDDIFEEL